MSYQCPECKFNTEIPDCALCTCTIKQISMLEPIPFLYSGIDCQEFTKDAKKPAYLDANHRIPNRPVNQIQKISDFPYKPLVHTSWIFELYTRTVNLMRRFVDHLILEYGRKYTNHLYEEMANVQTDLDRILDPTTKRTINQDNKEFWLSCANNYLSALQWRALKIIYH